MEIGRIRYRIICPECRQEFETGDPAKILPVHIIKGTNANCAGSEKTGREINRNIQPKIK